MTDPAGNHPEAPGVARSALSTEGLTVSFGGFRALASVDLELAAGARQALIGPNGAGKTTLINLLTGVCRPTHGHVRLGGRDITRLAVDKRVRLGLARTFQINSLFASLTPLQSLLLAIGERDGSAASWWRPLRQGSAAHDEAHVLLAGLKLAAVAERPVSGLAYGQQRLLEIALALATRPKILLLDEPAAGIAEGERGDIFDVLEALPAEVSVLFIEHDMDLVFRFARRISVLVAGELLVEGTPDAIARDPRVRAAYLGDASAGDVVG